MMVVARPLSVFLSLLPFSTISARSKVFISWVGLRGAVPIIFAIYPVVKQVPGSDEIFNIVFFITLLSLVLQGGTIVSSAQKLDLLLPSEPESQFEVELPEEAGEQTETTITEEILAEKGNTLRDLQLPKGVLVVFVKRDDKYIIPNGSLKLQVGDHLLMIASSEVEE